MKQVIGIYDAPQQHWVGDGFPVRSLFSYNSHGAAVSPFLLLDRAGPAEFQPGSGRRGVGQHPHRGFETVTLVYQGEVAHSDSTGQGGVIGPGDVQWMTAASGILHEEFHSDAFTRAGGKLDMVQLWVNLHAADKMVAPRYQAIRRDSIPVIALPNHAGSLRVIAGNYVDEQHARHTGPAQTFSPMNVMDVTLHAGAKVDLTAVEGWTTALVVLNGAVQVNGQVPAREAQLVLLDRAGDGLTLEATHDAVVLLLSGEPINEPIAGYGPFVMNTHEEIEQAIVDFNNGQFGRLAR